MMRSEFMIGGCVLVLVGLITTNIGYDKTQPTMMENVVSFAEAVSGKPAPEELHPSKVPGYALMTLGGALGAAGLVLILRSRQK